MFCDYLFQVTKSINLSLDRLIAMIFRFLSNKIVYGIALQPTSMHNTINDKIFYITFCIYLRITPILSDYME